MARMRVQVKVPFLSWKNGPLRQSCGSCTMNAVQKIKPSCCEAKWLLSCGISSRNGKGKPLNLNGFWITLFDSNL